MYCVNCGFAREESHKFCGKCGKEISSSDKENLLEKTSEVSEKTISLQKSNNSEPELQSIPVNHVKNENYLQRLFVGEKKADYYERKWSKGNQSWNWSAFFLGILWLGYRNMIKMIIVILAFFLVCDLVMKLMGIEDQYFSSMISIVLGITLGICGNYIYREHTLNTIENLKKTYVESDILELQISHRGGGSWRGVFVAISLLIAYVALSMVITMYVPPIHQSPLTEEVEATKAESSTNAGESAAAIEVDISKLLGRNINALENEQISEYMSMIDDTNESEHQNTYEVLKEMFLLYDISYELKDIRFLSVSDQEVKVKVKQISKVIEGGAAFRDNESVIVHTLKRQPEGDWLFTNSVAESVSYLD